MSSTGCDEQKKEIPTPEKKSALLEPTQQFLLQDPHRACTAEDVMRGLKLQSPKDLPKQAETLEKIAAALDLLVQEGLTRTIADRLFKVRLFLDKEKTIEHAYIGGLGNTRYRFNAPVFRLNIGVLSLFFVKDEKRKQWRVSVQDTTIGKNYCLVQPLGMGMHLFGTAPETKDGKTGWVIDGKYIEKAHITLTLSEDRVQLEDHRTPRGSRIDHLTDVSLTDYSQAAREFLKSASPAEQKDKVKRGRFVLERLLHQHQNFEASFFNAVVDFILLKESK